MSSEVVISVENVSKAYRMWESPASRLTAPLIEGIAGLLPPSGSWLKKKAQAQYRDFWALQDISFEVRKGENVGVVGRNGSGKSTLLQIITGTMQPTSGRTSVRGRVAAILELGSGFNPEFSGRENVYLNGAVLGLSRSEINACFDSIAAFADIGDFMDQPVKVYSSGMMMRLAFAVQTAVAPDILIVDEALAVGDAPFQAKCFQRMRELSTTGVAILIVSHDINTVRTTCQRALCLSAGKVDSYGSSKMVCDHYQILCMQEQGIVGNIETLAKGSPIEAAAAFHLKHGPRDREFTKRANQQRSGNGAIRLIDCYISDKLGRPVSLVEFKENVQICWLMEAREAVRSQFTLGITVKTLKGSEILSATDKEHEHFIDLEKGQIALVTMPFSFPLRADRYYITTSLFRFPAGKKFLHGSINFDESELLDLVEYACYFEVGCNRRWAHYGPVQQDSSIEIKTLAPDT